MHRYTQSDLLRLAKRFHNTKRTYLLVDPLQGKHMPVKPSDALTMLHAFGEVVKEKYPDARLVIGFAETATAVGMAVAETIGDECQYIHTTRENLLSENNWIEFLEEHSHATEQKLSATGLEKWITDTDTIIFVDDEISTGKTIINFINQLCDKYPQIRDKKLVAASIINRVSAENNKKMLDHGIESISLIQIDNTDFTESVAKYTISEAAELEEGIDVSDVRIVDSAVKLMNPRLIVNTGKYRKNCQEFAASFLDNVQMDSDSKRILVLGSEECMYPAIVLGEMLEKKLGAEVYTHSSTRSPIGICQDEDYPIKSGYKIKSFYDNERNTYIYNLDKYDQVIVVTDSNFKGFDAGRSLLGAVVKEGNSKVVLYRSI